MLSCVLIGVINGIGSLFYYSGLSRLDASRASLLGALYPVWVIVFLSASGQVIRKLTLVRLLISLSGAVLVTSPWTMGGLTDYLGVMLMAAYAGITGWYLVMGQWVLSDVPSQSGTLYILTGMAVTVAVARVLGGGVVNPISDGRLGCDNRVGSNDGAFAFGDVLQPGEVRWGSDRHHQLDGIRRELDAGFYVPGRPAFLVPVVGRHSPAGRRFFCPYGRGCRCRIRTFL